MLADQQAPWHRPPDQAAGVSPGAIGLVPHRFAVSLISLAQINAIIQAHKITTPVLIMSNVYRGLTRINGRHTRYYAT